MKRSQKIASGAVAAVLAAATVFTGTFAWRNTFATAPVLRAVGTLNPGGRLHDDFNGESKYVYVENFTDPGSGENIYARIRLDEYMEFGKNAGRKDGSGNAVHPLVPGTSINNPAGWTTHIPGETVFSDYWKFETGGSTVYMPTFNRDKDSTRADINGTYHGTDSDDDVHFDDYVEYSEGDTLTAPARYDADDNAYDEGDEAVENANYVLVEETHTAANTLSCTVLTMAEWKASGGQRGSFWVWDTDGWCYWANPIAPGTATGCLLNAVKPASEPGNTWYYGINVVAQFITADDAGRNSDTGFFTGGVAPTDDAIELLNIIGVNTDYTGVVNVTPYAGSSFVELGYPLAFNASVFVPGADPADQHVTWSVDGNTDPATTIDENGVLTIGPGETVGEFLTVTAFSPRYGLTGEASVEITVNGAVVVTPTNGVPESQLGVPKQFDAATSVPAYAGTVDQSVIWSLTGNQDPNTTIDENGVLTLGPDEPVNNVLSVTATHPRYGLLGVYDTAVALLGQVNVEPVSGDDAIPVGGDKPFAVDLDVPNADPVDDTVVWSLSGNTSSRTTIDQDGVVHFGGGETIGNTLTVTATSQVYGLLGSYSFEYTLPLAVNAIEPTENTVDTTIVMDNVEYYVLYKDTDNNRALLLTKKIQGVQNFSAEKNNSKAWSSRWDISNARNWMNNNWLNGKTELQKYILNSEISTQNISGGYYTTTDKVFALSSADVFGLRDKGGKSHEWFSVTAASDPRDYTVVEGDDGVVLTASIPNLTSSAKESGVGKADYNGVLFRSPVDRRPNTKTYGMNYVNLDSRDLSECICHRKMYVRPAMWVDISQPEAEELEP